MTMKTSDTNPFDKIVDSLNQLLEQEMALVKTSNAPKTRHIDAAAALTYVVDLLGNSDKRANQIRQLDDFGLGAFLENIRLDGEKRGLSYFSVEPRKYLYPDNSIDEWVRWLKQPGSLIERDD